MDGLGKSWYFSCMVEIDEIPHFNLYSETSPFPDVVHCERIKTRASERGWVISPHRHSQMAQVFIIQSGHAKYQMDGQTGGVKPKQFLFVPPLIVHGFQFTPETEGLVVSVPTAVMRGVVEGTFPAIAKPLKGKLTDPLKKMIELLDDCLNSTMTFRATVAVGLTHAILGHVAENGQFEKAEGLGNHLHHLDTLISESMGKNLSAADYASALSITTGHLSRLCRGAKGLGATAYIETATMSEACRQLAFTRQTVSEIGYRLGYKDPSYFARRFKVILGVTPSKYRADFLG